jgi:hypothetical protein
MLHRPPRRIAEPSLVLAQAALQEEVDTVAFAGPVEHIAQSLAHQVDIAGESGGGFVVHLGPGRERLRGI